MKYMGSKSRIAKFIVPIIQSVINTNEMVHYIEPFCGGCNVIDKITCDRRTASDINPYLIALFKHLQNGGELIPCVTRDFYSLVRSDYNQHTGLFDDWQIGNVGFLASYNGRFFDGGYAQPGYEKTKNGSRYRDYYRETSDNITKQMPQLESVIFECCDYRKINPVGAVIYCDPPYVDTKQYANARAFDYTEFWSIMRKWSENNFVFISETTAPDDFIPLWKKAVVRTIKAKDKMESTEKLFVFSSGKFADTYGADVSRWEFALQLEERA